MSKPFQVNSFYSREQLELIGFRALGDNVSISCNARFYSPGNISIGNHVRIDDYCILTGEIILGSYIHISAHCLLYGSHGIVMEDFSGLSPRSTIFSSSDDFSGAFMIGPMMSEELTNVTGGKVVIRKFCQVGAGSVVMPDLEIGEGAVIGAMSYVNKDIDSWTINAGIPARLIKPRLKSILNHEKRINDSRLLS